jgi:hypothetical protein
VVWWLIPYRREELPIDAAAGAAGASTLDALLQRRDLFDDDGSGGDSRHRVTGQSEGNSFKLVVHPPPWHRIPYLPVICGVVEGDRMVVTARPPLPEVIGLAALFVLLVATRAPAWFMLGAFASYHVAGCGAFAPLADRVLVALRSECARRRRTRG